MAKPEDGEEPGAGENRSPLRVDQSFLTIRSEIDRLFEDFLRECKPPFRWRGSGYNPFGRVEMEIGHTGEVLPRADMAETEAGYTLTLELPGVAETDIEISLANGLLIIEGNKRPPAVDEDLKVHVSERHYGAFRRTFRVPAAADEDALRAITRDGVLTVIMPKAGYGDPALATVEPAGG